MTSLAVRSTLLWTTVPDSMCPRRPFRGDSHSAVLPPLTAYTEWVSSARCTIAVFRRHLTTGAIYCDSCFANLTPRQQSLYERVIRHYITIGDDSRYEECAPCSRRTVGTVPVREATCGVCPRALAGFLAYIARHELTPFQDHGPTIICIREFCV